jgi:acetolactate synthase-1/2/3 large subunit
VTLPITKHNYLVTRAARTSPDTLREAFYIARSGRPGPVLVDITKDAQQASVRLRVVRHADRLPGYRPGYHLADARLARRSRSSRGRAPDHPRRPRHHPEATARSAFAEKTDIPVA